MLCSIGIDDTDSKHGGCTTYVGLQILQGLTRQGCRVGTYPRLVRLNPNVPFKTRGNGAVCLEFDSPDPDGAFETARRIMQDNSDVADGANSGLVFVDGRAPGFFSQVYEEAVRGSVNHRRILKLLAQEKVRHATLGNGMGVVGATASLGFSPHVDHTYELIAYRTPRSCGKPRLVDAVSVKRMELATFPHTFNSYDHLTGRVLIAPHGPDPVFLGIRADSPDIALRAFGMLHYEERLLGHLIYLSNQCTDAHVNSRLSPPAKSYESGWVEGVFRAGRVAEGGHLYFELESDQDLIVNCAVYRPTHDLRRMAGDLIPGDKIRVSGGVRRPSSKHRQTLNVEKIEVLSLAPHIKEINPSCERCGGSTKSEGQGQGFQCRACGNKSGSKSKQVVRLKRRLVPGIYLPSSGSQRHLTKQLIRYGNEVLVEHSLIEGWMEPASSVRPSLVLSRSRR